MSGAQPPSVFIKLFHKTALPNDGDAQQVPIKWHRTMDDIGFPVRILSRCRPLPDAADAAAGVCDAFAFAEQCMDTLVSEVAAQSPSVLCMHPECGADATRAVTWYPFNVRDWDGVSEPVYTRLYNNPPMMLTPSRKTAAAAIVTWAWCGASRKCKGEMILAMLNTFSATAVAHQLTGGQRPYCVECGAICSDAMRIVDFLPYCSETCIK